MESLKNLYRHGLRLCLLALPLFALAAPVAAQNYESFYGERTTRDGSEDVKAVRYCPNKGSILVGTRVHSTLPSQLTCST